MFSVDIIVPTYSDVLPRSTRNIFFGRKCMLPGSSRLFPHYIPTHERNTAELFQG